jgi:arsenate reductase
MAKTDDITIFHNPNCSTSRKALQIIRDAGHTPTVVEYLKVGWTKAQIKDLLSRMGATPRDILRTRGTPAEELGLTAPAAKHEAILDAMVAHPVLVERPIVASAKGVALGRPLEKIEPLI